MTQLLTETYSHNAIKPVAEASENGQKHWYMKGLFLQASDQNRNGRIYPRHIIAEAVKSMQDRLASGESIGGELDHPEGYDINSDRISHMIQEIHVDEQGNGVGSLKVIGTPMGLIVQKLIEEGFKLGVSSRGMGVLDYNNVVTEYTLVTVDIVNRPSAQEAYPTPIYEQMMMNKTGREAFEVAKGIYNRDEAASKYFTQSVLDFMKSIQ